MKKLRQILIAVLVVSMVFNTVGCGNSNQKAESKSKYEIVDGKYIVENGMSNYKLVIPKDAGNTVQVAASEFNKFFSESTSVNLPIVSDSELSADDKYISIGETTQLTASGIKYDTEELGNDGYRIVTEGENIYLIGGSEYGSLYAVYGLLERIIDYDFFSEDSYTVKEGVSKLPLYKFAETDIPDIASRTASDGVISNDNNTLYRMRVRPYLEDFLSVNGSWAHNSMLYVKDAKNASSKWFNSSKTQLCYTARGDEKEYENLLNACFNALKKELINDKSKSAVTLTMEDNNDTCTCKACTAAKLKYGAISSTIILFLNDLNKKVNTWFDTKEGQEYKRDLKILFFAYLGYEEPPATYNEETGKYEANAGIKLDDGVYCYLCPINMDYYRSIKDKANEEFYNNMKAWSDITDGNLYLWYYSTNYNYYLAPYDNFDSMLVNYKFAVDCGAKYLFDLRQHNETGAVTGWSNLKSYLYYKLAWDVNADMSTLMNQFFDGYFGPASEKMRQFFDEFRTLTKFNLDNNEVGGKRTLYYEIVQETFWPKDILQKWIDTCNEAEKSIEKLKDTDYEKYQMYLDHINTEKLSVLYLFVECYSYNTSEDVINEYKAEFKKIADSFNLTQAAENTTISEVYTKWGLN